jgi:hypothetical protein
MAFRTASPADTSSATTIGCQLTLLALSGLALWGAAILRAVFASAMGGFSPQPSARNPRD